MRRVTTIGVQTLLLLIVITLTGCGGLRESSDYSPIQKRKYRKGFFVDIGGAPKEVSSERRLKKGRKEQESVHTEGYYEILEEEVVDRSSHSTSVDSSGVDESLLGTSLSREEEMGSISMVARMSEDRRVRKRQRFRQKMEKAKKSVHHEEGTEVHWGAKWGLMLGIGAFAFAFVPILNILSFFMAILAIVFSSIALADIRAEPGKYAGRSKAVAGKTLGTIFLVLAIALVFVFLLLLISSVGG